MTSAVQNQVARQATADFDIRPYVFGMAGLLAGPANVIMQLSWPGVGYGVVESKVHSGSALKRPVKRARTTFTYLGVALLGDDEDRKAYRRAVSKQHVQVRSDENSKSPVEYNALDPELQLWVAACLYYGFVDVYERMHGQMDDATAEAMYQYSARMGTTLQVRQDMWPADRAAFAAYWSEGVAKAHIDDTVRTYLDGLTRLSNMPKIVQRLQAKQTLFWTKGFLPPEFREQMQYTWTEKEEAKFTRQLRRYGKVERFLPRAVKLFPFNVLLYDTRRRRRKGIPLV